MNCRDCLHYERCKKLGIFNVETFSVCEDFTARSEWVHLPCKAEQQLWFVENGEVKSRQLIGLYMKNYRLMIYLRE